MVIEGETHLEQQAALEDAGGDGVRGADGAEQDGVMLAEGIEVGVGEQLTVAQVTTRAQVVVGGLDVVAHRAQDLEGLLGDLRADAVSANDCKFHSVGFLSHLLNWWRF